MNTGCDVIITPCQLAYTDESLFSKLSVLRYSRLLISFSKAELILVNSWSRVQQIVYYLIRRLASAELYSPFTPLNNYHIKTLMLWSVEGKPVEWWEENNELVICCELLKRSGHHVRQELLPELFSSRIEFVQRLGYRVRICKQSFFILCRDLSRSLVYQQRNRKGKNVSSFLKQYFRRPSIKWQRKNRKKRFRTKRNEKHDW